MVIGSRSLHPLFDGASKGNPRATGARGVLYGPGGNIVSTFSWNLGVATNNQAKAYALLQGLSITKARNIRILSVMGDSKNTIRHLWLSTLLVDASLYSIFK
jgi:ribonuclease HI